MNHNKDRNAESQRSCAGGAYETEHIARGLIIGLDCSTEMKVTKLFRASWHSTGHSCDSTGCYRTLIFASPERDQVLKEDEANN